METINPSSDRRDRELELIGPTIAEQYAVVVRRAAVRALIDAAEAVEAAASDLRTAAGALSGTAFIVPDPEGAPRRDGRQWL